MNNFETYWKEYGRYLDLVNTNFSDEEKLKDFAAQIFKYQSNSIDSMQERIDTLESEVVTNKKYCNCE